MNIQIFGTKKNFDSKKAERYFKERGIKYQFVDMKEKGLSKGEFTSVCQAVGGYEKLIDEKCKDRDLLALIKYIAEEDRAEKILENQKVLKLPIVRKPMSKIVNITSKEDKDQKLQDIANSLQELKDVMAEVIEAYEEDNADSRKMDTLTEALDALEDAYEAVSDVLLEEL